MRCIITDQNGLVISDITALHHAIQEALRQCPVPSDCIAKCSTLCCEVCVHALVNADIASVLVNAADHLVHPDLNHMLATLRKRRIGGGIL